MKRYIKSVRGRESPNYYEDTSDRDSNEDFSIARFYDYCNPNRIDFEIIEDYGLTPIQREALDSLLV